MFAIVTVTIQYKVLASEIKQAFYELSEPREQLKSYVLNNVRAQIPKYDLDPVCFARDYSW